MKISGRGPGPLGHSGMISVQVSVQSIKVSTIVMSAGPLGRGLKTYIFPLEPSYRCMICYVAVAAAAAAAAAQAGRQHHHEFPVSVLPQKSIVP